MFKCGPLQFEGLLILMLTNRINGICLHELLKVELAGGRVQTVRQMCLMVKLVWKVKSRAVSIGWMQWMI